MGGAVEVLPGTRARDPYRVAERLFPSLPGSRVGAFAIRV